MPPSKSSRASSTRFQKPAAIGAFLAGMAVISSSPIKQGCDLGGKVKDTVLDLAAAERLRGPVSTGRSLLKSDAVHWVRGLRDSGHEDFPGDGSLRM
ncbi:hypothetical protein [Streptomyces venezuelae]|uniref:hypothetical protein n=1 Tax=Streptomyces venezuelae TaxID=54571 RepID=UPI0033200F26